MNQTEQKQFAKKLLQSYQRATFPSAPPAFYLVTLVLGLNSEEAMTTLKYLLPPAVLLGSVVIPQLGVRGLVKAAFDERLNDKPELRLKRLLEIPRRIEMVNLISTIVGLLWLTGGCSLLFQKSLWIIPWATFVMCILTLMVGIQIRVSLDKLLRPHVMTEFRRLRQFSLEGAGFYWPRQKWYLPYLFGLYVVCTMAFLLTVIGRSAYDTFGSFAAEMENLRQTQLSDAFTIMLDQLVHRVTLPLTLIGLYLIALAAISAWQLARYQSEGTRAVQEAIEGLASGNPRLPEWMSTDEIGDLSMATAKVFVHLKDFSLSLRDSARTLAQSAQTLGLSTSQQGEMLSRQASTMQETQVTAQEIKQTSDLAQKKTEGVLQHTQQAERISTNAEEAVEHVLGGLQDTREQVRQMAHNIQQLGEKAKQIGKITATVKDLTDQSNMLALNAAIEAVRSGEHGKGFGVVAREIRSLADQSIRATNHVRTILQDISSAIGTSVAMSERGAARVEEGLQHVREFGNSIRELSTIVRENGAAVRQISHAVSQQNTGIGEIFRAVSDMSALMDESMARMKASDEALLLVRDVAGKVGHFVDSYGWQQLASNPQEKPSATEGIPRA